MIKVTKKGNKAWVTFTHKPEQGESVMICGEWNDWSDEAMKAKKNGEYWITKVLPQDSAFEFGYRVDANAWHCDDELDRVDSPFGSQNSLLKL